MRQSAISFRSGRLNLDGIISIPDGISGDLPALVVCHSHPMLGGSMDDAVVVAICRATDAIGAATLRFNFRGGGDSDGRFTNGAEEHRDARAALDVLRRWPGVSGKRVAIAGYSFGAAMILVGFRRLKAARAVALVAPTVQSVRNKRFQQDARPRLVIASRDDKIAPSLAIQQELAGARQPLRFEELETADHSMRGHEAEIGQIVADFVSSSLS